MKNGSSFFESEKLYGRGMLRLTIRGHRRRTSVRLYER